MILVPFFEIPHRDRLAENVNSRCVQIIPRSTPYETSFWASFFFLVVYHTWDPDVFISNLLSSWKKLKRIYDEFSEIYPFEDTTTLQINESIDKAITVSMLLATSSLCIFPKMGKNSDHVMMTMWFFPHKVIRGLDLF